MYLIDNKPYLDLSNVIDVSGLEELRLDIILGIVKSKQYMAISSASTTNFYDTTISGLVSEIGNSRVYDEQSPYYEYFKELNFDIPACGLFLSYAIEAQTLGHVLYLRRMNNRYNFSSKHLESECTDTAINENFLGLRKWIDSLKIFDQLGRMTIWLAGPGEHGNAHYDAYCGHLDNFILFNLDYNRFQVFLLNDDGTKEFIKSTASVFDVRNYHGFVGGNGHSWILRVDGIFNQDWAKSVGIYEHFKIN